MNKANVETSIQDKNRNPDFLEKNSEVFQRSFEEAPQEQESKRF